MSFSFRYKSVRLKSGKIILRPMIPIALGEEKVNLFGILDSGSDITIIPKEIADVIKVHYTGENEVSGISGMPLRAREGKIKVHFGKKREFYDFEIPVLVPEKEGLNIIIGRMGFFSQFKITFSESERKIEFKRPDLGVLFNLNSL